MLVHVLPFHSLQEGGSALCCVRVPQNRNFTKHACWEKLQNQDYFWPASLRNALPSWCGALLLCRGGQGDWKLALGSSETHR